MTSLYILVCLAFASAVHADEHSFDADLLDLYANYDLPYRCLPYIRKAPIAVCDCIACSEAQPNFQEKMCKFYEQVKKMGKADLVNAELIAACGFQHICSAYPPKCCNPENMFEKKMAKGCPLCRPAGKSKPTSRGLHATCAIAQLEAEKGRPTNDSMTWYEATLIINTFIKQVNLHPKCISYPMLKIAKDCDCQDCLAHEPDLRGKLCKLVKLIEDKGGFFSKAQYYKNFCNFKACPNVPNQCCDSAADSEEYPTDSFGCPKCIPTTQSFGFGPRCIKDFGNISHELKQKVYNLQ